MSYYTKLCSFETFDILKIYLQWPVSYGKYGLGWQWPMLHNTLTVAEWANLWEGKIIKCVIVYCSTEWLQCSNKWLENYFSDEQKQKDAGAAAYHHIKAAKIPQVIIILRTFVLEILISVISVLLDIHSIFICSIIGFRAIDCPSTACANMPLSYIVQNMWTHIQTKDFVGTRGGKRYAIKLFPNFYMFHCKKHSFCPK